jgi:6-pyruvoyl-tetrahydropterin synthase
MIEFKDIKEKEILVYYANEFEDSNILKVIESGVSSESEAEDLAKFYWKIVDKTIEKKDLEYILERIYTTLHIHCGNNGYLDVWDREIP